MGAKTEEFFYLLLWTAEMFSRPTFRNLNESFEGWAYRKGLLRQLHRLEREQWLQGQCGPNGDRLHRLTESGRLRALGGRDPEARWGRTWDGRWRLVLFDVPEARTNIRNKLRRYLKTRGFGYLQNSVWISPDLVTEQRALLADGPVEVESLLLLEAHPCAGETDAQIVTGAWDFAAINQRYANYQAILSQRPSGLVKTESAARTFHRWMSEERTSWNEALSHDPLLPAALLPKDYAGRRAWQQRTAVMRQAGEQMLAFKVKKSRDNE